MADDPVAPSETATMTPLFTVVCPNQNCGARNQVYDESHNRCFKCGWKMFPNPQEREAVRAALACPFCRTRSARRTTEGYSAERGVPEREARYMGLWRTRTVGVCDHCGQRWGLSSKGAPTACPACASTDSGRFGYGVQRNCWECGEVWKSPPPPKPVTRMSRLGDAITMTGIVGMFLFFGGIGLFWVAVGIAFVVVAPVLLVPLGMIALVVALFYFTSPSKRRTKEAQDPGPLSGPPADGRSATADSPTPEE